MAKRIPKEILDYFKKQGAKGGKAGTEARMEKTTPEQRSAIAKKAAAARWANVEPAKKPVAQKRAAKKTKKGA